MDGEFGHRIFWDDENQVVRVIGNGPADETAAAWFLAETERMAREHGDQLDWILDLRGIASTTSRGRKILTQASSHSSIHKYAMVGASSFLRTVANFINNAGGQTNPHHFATDDQAFAWIQED